MARFSEAAMASFWVKAAVVVGVLGAAGYAAQGRVAALLAPTEAVPVVRAAQPVRVTAVRYAPAVAAHRFTGTVRPQHAAALGFRVPGKLVARLVETGDVVQAGQILARLDDSDARLTLATAEAEVAAAGTDLDRAMADQRRARGLFEGGHVTQAVLDGVVSGLAQARGRRDRALRGRDQAANALTYTVLVADAAGVVTAVTADAGQVLAAGQPAVTVAEQGAVDVVFALPEQMRGALEEGQATARLWGEAGADYALTLRDISPDVDPLGRTYRVRMALDAAVTLGRTMTVTLTGAGGAPVAALPLAAVVNDGTAALVWRLTADGRAVQAVPVEIAALSDGGALLRAEGLGEGDLVVSLGAGKINPKEPVRVVETTDAPAL